MTSRRDPHPPASRGQLSVPPPWLPSVSSTYRLQKLPTNKTPGLATHTQSARRDSHTRRPCGTWGPQTAGADRLARHVTGRGRPASPGSAEIRAALWTSALPPGARPALHPHPLTLAAEEAMRLAGRTLVAVPKPRRGASERPSEPRRRLAGSLLGTGTASFPESALPCAASLTPAALRTLLRAARRAPGKTLAPGFPGDAGEKGWTGRNRDAKRTVGKT